MNHHRSYHWTTPIFAGLALWLTVILLILDGIKRKERREEQARQTLSETQNQNPKTAQHHEQSQSR